MDTQLSARCNQAFQVKKKGLPDGYGGYREGETTTIKGYLVDKLERAVSFAGEEILSKRQIISPVVLDVNLGDVVVVEGREQEIKTYQKFRKIDGPPGTYNSMVLYL